MKEELKHKIIIRGEHRPSYTIDSVVSTHCYYVLDLNTYEVSSSIPLTQTPNSVFGSTLFVGSKLLIFGDPFVGDIKNNLCPVYSYDLNQAEQGWKRAPSPLTPRDLRVQGVEFGGKIYVFRGSDDRCSCEVFDPLSNEWSRIRSPPRHKRIRMYITGPVLADHKGNRILVWFENLSMLFAYYPNEDCWECVAQEFRGSHEQITVDNGVIYSCDRYCFNMSAFHIASKQRFQVCLPSGFERENFKYRSLLNRGNGLLCLLGYVYKPREWPMTATTTCDMIVRAVEFKVNYINEADKQVHLTLLSSKNFVLPDPCNILHCLLV